MHHPREIVWLWRSGSRPHRPRVGGASDSALQPRKRAENAPTDLVSVERVILHYRLQGAVPPAPTDLVSVERMIEDQERGAAAFGPGSAESYAPPTQGQ